jgi:hypothetical protein
MSSGLRSLSGKIAIILYWTIVYQLITRFTIIFQPFEGLDADLPYLNVWYSLFYLLKKEYAANAILGACFFFSLVDLVISMKYQKNYLRLWLVVHAIILFFAALPFICTKLAYLHINFTLKGDG